MPISLSYTVYGYEIFSRLSNNIHALEDNKQRRDLFSNLSPRISRNITFTYLLNYQPGCHLCIILISRPGLRVFRSPAIFIFCAFTSCYNNPSCSIFSPNFLFFSFYLFFPSQKVKGLQLQSCPLLILAMSFIKRPPSM